MADAEKAASVASTLLHNLIAPTSGAQQTIFYLCWIFLFLFINIVWDIASSRTPAFHILDLPEKSHLLHAASSLPSNFLIIVACIDPHVWDLAIEIKIPLVFSGLNGLIRAIPALCPYQSAPTDGMAVGV